MAKIIKIHLNVNSDHFQKQQILEKTDLSPIYDFMELKFLGKKPKENRKK